ncbi:uncharacterized protein C11orf24 homolog [Rana temporaria]|uniref:uncharacterized protein C11orf24 homolog n=1 Tax=Rana temporaria TaxID=8407 RepID=UPI001AADE38C|nr:uncharacterized protein C11orf24 homolog [Rana temporaria]XP_040184856.1 uncharacterized protein C11orf24 homolog [Rana temporaria]XP_040184858.1 uncharacterized protein C11orf24 homolog [Rana temporaria]XP_040184859.1 uncharacterized protein C11orf24 homolog [Rana temporaria]
MWRSLILFCCAILCLSEGRFNTLSHHEIRLLPPQQCQKQCLLHVDSEDIDNCSRLPVHRYWCVLRHCFHVCRETEVKHIKVEPFDANHIKKRRKRNASESRRVRRKRRKTVAITTTTTFTNNGSTTKSKLEPTTEPIKEVRETTTTTTTTTDAATTSTPLTTESMRSATTSTNSVPIVNTTSAALTTIGTNSVTPNITIASTTPYNATIQPDNELTTTTTNIADTPPAPHVAKNITPLPSTHADSTSTTLLTNTAAKTIRPETTRQRDPTSTVTETTVITTSSAQTLLTIVVPTAVSPTTKTTTAVPSTISTTSLPSTTPVFDSPATITLYLTHAVSPNLTSPTKLARPSTPEVPKMQNTSKTTSASISDAASSASMMSTTSKLFRPVSSEHTSVVFTKSVQVADQADDEDGVFIVAEGVAKQIQNTSILLAVLMLGIMFFLAAIVLLVVQAYESYKKKDYTQVDYLINGMYAESEM